MIDLMPGLVFGLTDNGLLIFGAATGIGIERYFKKGSGVVGSLWGAGVGNTFSDFLGSVLDPTMHHMIGGIVLGCLIPLLLIPVLQQFYRE
jgi:hypothetical protein